MKPDIQQWGELSALLDQMLDLPEDAWEAWMRALPAQHALLVPQLREMAALARRAEHVDLIAPRPNLSATSLAELLPEPDVNEIPGDEIGPYRLIRLLGRGGMGVVWLAERTDGVLKRPVALKLPNAGVNARKLAARFARERSILGALNHPNIAHLYDAGTSTAGQPYLVLEYVEGELLTAHCDALGLSVPARLQLFAQVLAAVQYAHGLLVIHRDLKPSNILVTPGGDVRLLDFGIAKLIGEHEFIASDLTQLTGRALTQHYASPEQVRGEVVGIASDVYSLGVLLYELLTGQRPYLLKVDSRSALEDAILVAEPTRPTAIAFREAVARTRSTTPQKLHATIKGDIEAILLKALKKAPEERYKTVEAFAQDIERYQAGEVVLAQPESRWYRSKKLVVRNKLATASAATVALSLAVGLGVATWQAREARLQTRVAEQESATAKALAEFMSGVFEHAGTESDNPREAQERPAREILELAAKKIETDTVMPARAKIAVLNTLSNIFGDLQFQRQSYSLAASAYELEKAQPEGLTFNSYDTLLIFIVASSDWGDPRTQDALDAAARILNAAPQQGANQWHSLYFEQAQFSRDSEGDLRKATDYSQRAAKYVAENPSLEDPPPIHVYRLLAGNYLDLGLLADAESMLTRASQPAKPKLHNFASALNHVDWVRADLRVEQRRFAEAETLYRGVHARLKNIAGEHAVLTLRAQAASAHLLLARSQPIAATVLSGQVKALFSTLKQALETDRNGTRLSLLHGRTSLAAGRLELGTKTLEKLLEGERSLRPKGELFVNAATQLIAAYGDVGREDEVRALLTDVATTPAISQGLVGSDFVTAHARWLGNAGKVNDATEVLRQATAQGLNFDANTWAGLQFRLAEAEVALIAGRVADARSRCAALLQQFGSSAKPADYALPEARCLLVLGRAHLREDRPIAAEQLLQRAVEIRQRLLDTAQSVELADARIALGLALQRLGKVTAAKAQLAQASTIYRRYPTLGAHLTEPAAALRAQVGSR